LLINLPKLRAQVSGSQLPALPDFIVNKFGLPVCSAFNFTALPTA
jgi:hypothetical protein